MLAAPSIGVVGESVPSPWIENESARTRGCPPFGPVGGVPYQRVAVQIPQPKTLKIQITLRLFVRWRPVFQKRNS